MLESAFRTSVLSKLPRRIHRQPMMANMMGCAGTPDTYLDYERDLWVEWKVLPVDGRMPAVLPTKATPTELQQRWLTRRWLRGGNACVIVGLKLRGRAYGFVLESPQEWSSASPLKLDRYTDSLRAAADLALYLEHRVTSCQSSPSSKPSPTSC